MIDVSINKIIIIKLLFITVGKLFFFVLLQVLLPAANLLQLTDVRDACCDFLQAQLHPTNCLGIRAFADLHGCLDLLNHAESYIEQHFP